MNLLGNNLKPWGKNMLYCLIKRRMGTADGSVYKLQKNGCVLDTMAH